MGKYILVTVLIVMMLNSCTKEEKDPVRTNSYIAPAPVVPVIIDTTLTRSYLALGDSYTIGQSVAVAERFPMQTATYLADQGIKFTTPEIIAQTGWTTGNLLAAVKSSPPVKPPYDIVTLLIGVNNQYQHRSQQEYAEDFLTLLNKALDYAGNIRKRVIVLSIPDYGVTPFASGSDKALIAREIDSFNVINKTIANNAGVNYLDITPASRLAANDRSLVAPDGLHPSGLQYKLWADGLLPIIKTALK